MHEFDIWEIGFAILRKCWFVGRPSHQSVRQSGPGAARDEEEDPGQPHVRGRGYIMCQESSQGSQSLHTLTPSCLIARNLIWLWLQTLLKTHFACITAAESPLTRIKFEFLKELICHAVARGGKLRDQICVGLASPRPTQKEFLLKFSIMYIRRVVT